MTLSCSSAGVTPREVIAYQRKQTDDRRLAVFTALERGAATIDEIIERIGNHFSRQLVFHYDKESGFSCRGHVEDSEVLESKYQYAEVSRTLVSLRRKGVVDRFEADSPPYLWYRLPS